MIRSTSSNSDKDRNNNQTSNIINESSSNQTHKPKIVTQPSISSSHTALNLSDGKNIITDCNYLGAFNSNKSKSMSTLDKISNESKPDAEKDKKSLQKDESNKDKEGENESKEFKLVSPYGDWCAFSGGSGTGGCIFTGPYEPMLMNKDEFSDQSFESTEESDAALDFTGPVGVTHNDFSNTEVVWAKRPALPWFPGIIIDPYTMTKSIKDLLKHINAPTPSKESLSDYRATHINCPQSDKIFFVFLFNYKKSWIWLPESKLRPFCKENDKLFLDNSPLLSTKYRKEMQKAYKKANKILATQQPAKAVLTKATR